MNKLNAHLKFRANQRYGYYLNRKARIELSLVLDELFSNTRIIVLEKQERGRYKVRIPIFMSKEAVRLNTQLRFGDWATGIYDRKLHRVVTLLPEEKPEDDAEGSEVSLPAPPATP